MTNRFATRMLVAAAALPMLAACALYDTITCPNENWVRHVDWLGDRYVGSNLADYERSSGLRPYQTAVRPQNRTEYSYSMVTSYSDGPSECIDHLEVDNATGTIMSVSSQGFCTGYCNR